MLVLGIETSCDETALAFYHETQGLLGHVVHSQVALHREYGGVVPELASREHVSRWLPLLQQLCDETGVNLKDISGVAYTCKPGLVGALLVGAAAGRTLAWSLGCPAVGVHHLEGHLLAPMLEAEPPEFPFLVLLVSGGHTQILEATALGQYRCLGETCDDAAGEAFDKVAKWMGLPYPGGPQLAQCARQGTPNRFVLTRPMKNQPNFDFSFSGLKTQTAQAWSALVNPTEQDRADLSWAFQEAVVDVLVTKVVRALQHTGHQTLVVAGGVGANQRLREQLTIESKQHGFKLFFPRLEFCTDNAAMIAYAGYRRLKQGAHEALAISVQARAPLSD